MSATEQQARLSGLARSLVQAELIDQDTAVSALAAAKKQKIQFVSYLVEHHDIAPQKIAEVAAQDFGTPLFDLDAIDMSTLPLDLVDVSLVETHRALPLAKKGSRLYLAVSDPTNHEGLDEIKFHTGLATDAILVAEDKLANKISAALDSKDSAYGSMLDQEMEDLDLNVIDDDDDGNDDSSAAIDDAPVVRYVNKILLDAINSGVSDIHFEPYEKSFRIRYRTDGLLHEKASPPVNIASRLTARIKVMARLNIAERRVPQDGRIKLALSKNRSIDFRVNTCPTLYGEKIVMRILDASAAQVGVDQLGFEPDQRVKFTAAIGKPYGMILVTGPTGSGKTVSLYTGLNMLNDPEVNISTAEDPVEIQVAGINQVNVNTKTGLTFAAALRAFLRQDPDIVMVGEIRDLETAEISVKAAQTGHLVLSTLHTNDAPQTLTRLANMGVPPFNIASSVNLIMAQRLARRLCEHCKVIESLPEETLIQEGFTEQQITDGVTVYKPVGCDKCTNGYKGRVGIFEMMPISEDIKRLILEGGNAIQLKEQALAEDYYDLRTAGLMKVFAGLTSLEEINRVTKE